MPCSRLDDSLDNMRHANDFVDSMATESVEKLDVHCEASEIWWCLPMTLKETTSFVRLDGLCQVNLSTASF
jgi:hypothetical protein